MKKVLASLVAVGFGLACLAAWVSFQVEAEVRLWVAQLEARPDVRVLGNSFERGWLESTSETRFELRGAAGAIFMAPFEWAGREHVRRRVGFRLDQQIEHGPISLWRWLQSGASGSPFLAQLRSTLVLDQETQAELTAVFGRLPALNLSLSIRASGEALGRFSMSAAPLRPRDVEPGQAPRWTGRFEGLRGRIAVADRIVTVEIESGGLQLKGAQLDFAVEGWNGRMVGAVEQAASRRADHTVRAWHLVLGEGAVQASDTAPGSGAAGDGAPSLALALEGLAWRSSEDGERLHLAATADRARWNATDLEELHLDLDWPKDADAASREEPASHWTGELGFAPELTIGTLEGRLPEGPFYVSGKLSFAPPPADAGSAVASPLPGDVQAELEIRVPEAWVRRILGEQDERLTAWLDEGQIGRDRGSLGTRLQWNGRTLTANGLPFEALDLVERRAPGATAGDEVAAGDTPAGAGPPGGAAPAMPEVVAEAAPVPEAVRSETPSPETPSPETPSAPPASPAP